MRRSEGTTISCQNMARKACRFSILWLAEQTQLCQEAVKLIPTPMDIRKHISALLGLFNPRNSSELSSSSASIAAVHMAWWSSALTLGVRTA